MEFIIFIGILTGLILITFIYNTVNAKNKMKRILLDEYGKTKEPHVSETMSYIKQFNNKNKEEDHYLDDITASDLDIDKVFTILNHTQSRVGTSVYYWFLRQQDTIDLNQLETKITYFEEDKDMRLKVQQYLYTLSSNTNYDSFFINDTNVKLTKFEKLIAIILRVLAVGALFYAIWEPAGFLAITAIFITNFGITLWYKKRLEVLNTATLYNIELFNIARKISKLNIPPLNQEIQQLHENLKPFARLKSSFSYLVQSEEESSGVENFFIFDIIKGYFLLPIIAGNMSEKYLTTYSEEITKLYKTVGLIDMYISIGSYRQSLEMYCTPDFKSQTLAFENMVHPLLEKKAIANTAILTNYSLITGSNASGKSTFIRAVALNVLFAQRMNMCLAQSFSLHKGNIVTSMALRDDVLAGDSYFIKETKSIKRIIDIVKAYPDTYVFIDEILRGTNTIERIAASTSILKGLLKYKCSVIVATHDIELTKILDDSYNNYHFKESIEGKDVVFDYLIYSGPSGTRNAIKLLEVQGYDQELVDLANEMVAGYERQNKWF